MGTLRRRPASRLFTALPEPIRNDMDMAFHDRWHAYPPRLGDAQDAAGFFHAAYGPDLGLFGGDLPFRAAAPNYTALYDRKAVARTTSGLMKWLHPGGDCSRAEMEEYLPFTIELRRRVKEQLKRMGGVEFSRVNLSYLDKQWGQETFVTCKELGSTQLIPNGPLNPVDVFSVGFDPDLTRGGSRCIGSR